MMMMMIMMAKPGCPSGGTDFQRIGAQCNNVEMVHVCWDLEREPNLGLLNESTQPYGAMLTIIQGLFKTGLEFNAGAGN